MEKTPFARPRVVPVALPLLKLDDQQARFAVRVPHVGGAHQFVGDGANKRKQTIIGILELPVGVSAG